MRTAVTLLAATTMLVGCNEDDGPAWDGTTDGITDTVTDTTADVPVDTTTDTPVWGARLTGTVWGPSRMFPVSGALVAAYHEMPDPIPEYRFCEYCVDLPTGVANTLSGPDGSFELQVPVDMDYYIVVQKGQFRRIREYHAPPDAGDYELTEDMTTLPNIKDQDIGDMIPNIALVYGDYDALEDVLGKAGIGAVDGSFSFEWGSEDGVFDVFDNSSDMVESHGEPLNDLIYHPERMINYHVIFFACSYNAIFEFMDDEVVQENLREYVRGGGKLYVSDYAYTVADMPWTDFVWFHDPLHGGCVENRFPDGCNHGPPFDAPSRSPDEGLSDWLLAVDPDATVNSMGLADFETRENWDTIGDLFESYVGDDFEGMPVYATPRVWVEGIWDYEAEDVPDPDTWDYDTYHPFTVSWPWGCGRVLFTTYHTVGDTSGGKHPGFLTQELILWYLIMEIQVCQETELI